MGGTTVKDVSSLCWTKALSINHSSKLKVFHLDVKGVLHGMCFAHNIDFEDTV